MKPCNTCKIPKELSEYHKNKASPDGHSHKCKACKKIYAAKYFIDHSDIIKKYSSRPESKELIKAYLKSKDGKRSRAEINHRTNNKYPNSLKSTRAVTSAIKSGKLTRPNKCEECPSATNIQAHHDDYNKPLDVRWLCIKCHRLWHKSNNALNRK